MSRGDRSHGESRISVPPIWEVHLQAVSRGPGRLQRDIIALLDYGWEGGNAFGRSLDYERGKPIRTADLAYLITIACPDDWSLDADHFERQVRRALTSLEHRGIVTSELIPNLPHYPHKSVRLWRISDDVAETIEGKVLWTEEALTRRAASSRRARSSDESLEGR